MFVCNASSKYVFSLWKPQDNNFFVSFVWPIFTFQMPLLLFFCISSPNPKLIRRHLKKLPKCTADTWMCKSRHKKLLYILPNLRVKTLYWIIFEPFKGIISLFKNHMWKCVFNKNGQDERKKTHFIFMKKKTLWMHNQLQIFFCSHSILSNLYFLAKKKLIFIQSFGKNLLCFESTIPSINQDIYLIKLYKIYYWSFESLVMCKENPRRLLQRLIFSYWWNLFIFSWYLPTYSISWTVNLKNLKHYFLGEKETKFLKFKRHAQEIKLIYSMNFLITHQVYEMCAF